MRSVKTLDEWNVLSGMLKEHGYTPVGVAARLV